MSFWKKVFGQTDLTPEYLEKIEREKAEKKQKREEANKRFQEEQEKRREEKRIKKEKQKEEEQLLIEQFYGKDAGVGSKLAFAANKDTFRYVGENLLRADEEILSFIQAEYDKSKKREIKGLLFATNDRMFFAFVRGVNQYIEEFDYSKMKGISLARDGFLSKELYIDYGSSRKKFDDIIDDDKFKDFLQVVNEKIVDNIKKPITKTRQKKPAVIDLEGVDKYKQLERIAELKDKGILTEEEFNVEKKKILN
ncbi:SHOCT domain-containing protein [Priestia flexa]|uniref:SHOCT domain-containing protein n=1 Tax=Priestia flexa TaxID=86664 RepID=UPI002891D76A|nr:SHOCT domain-containing protein [Priestia flexa]MDT2048032.1 SHOCT domain-containing protein [Priestia flexa]